ncbi:MAG: sigma-70 family RNA polymerase sigma factor [Salinisphaera sp.]|jgi:RNA polymerase sigma-70 factor (ECF subfamily)|nr:sigma-70 family RNA polymerase sigma factor [Salinisphaera sp.]
MNTQQQRFQALTLPYLDRLVSAARRHLSSHELAEDLVQDTYLKAWRAFASLDDELRVYPWLYRIMRRELADYYRTRARRSALMPIVDLGNSALEAIQAEGADPFEHVLDSMSGTRMAYVLALMPDEFAEALTLHDVEGFAYREIAQLTDAPIGTVMSRISRARRVLAGLLLKHQDTSDIALKRAAGQGSDQATRALDQ